MLVPKPEPVKLPVPVADAPLPIAMLDAIDPDALGAPAMKLLPPIATFWPKPAPTSVAWAPKPRATFAETMPLALLADPTARLLLPLPLAFAPAATPFESAPPIAML
ncbi:hypothetical protein TM239_10260 [Bradyrhizobium sp. TM239]|nr:hypothetical protein TM239_10260 [Bradyrhizobium sp. TM239]